MQSQEIAIDKDQDDLDLDEVDLPISKTASLYVKPAPELEGIIGW